ncbi:unnamed protein product [Polarella glacialis]|uniref:Secreted protein n=1 Tax=Polarella glacialis TaxID=89957 RepID=A0A813FYC2_POLGL|nr:unnamed protein product [Polarella glacialis]
MGKHRAKQVYLFAVALFEESVCCFFWPSSSADICVPSIPIENCCRCLPSALLSADVSGSEQLHHSVVQAELSVVAMLRTLFPHASAPERQTAKQQSDSEHVHIIACIHRSSS